MTPPAPPRGLRTLSHTNHIPITRSCVKTEHYFHSILWPSRDCFLVTLNSDVSVQDAKRYIYWEMLHPTYDTWELCYFNNYNFVWSIIYRVISSIAISFCEFYRNYGNTTMLYKMIFLSTKTIFLLLIKINIIMK